MENANDKKRKSVLLRILLILAAVILVAVIAVALLAMNLLNRLSRPVDSTGAETPPPATATPDNTPPQTPGATPAPTPTPSPTPEPWLPLSDLYPQTKLTQAQYDTMAAHNSDVENYINILLLGVDRRDTKSDSRSDTMMIATVDKKNGQLKLTSLMRDLLVDIPGRGYGKLNSASAYGGVPLLLETLEHNFHFKLQHYVLVDFSMFEKIVDELGGITVKMTAEEISAANDCIAGLNKQWGVEYLWDGFIFAEPGNVKLTGKQALGFARVRHSDSDFHRVNRQFEILNAVYALFRSKPLTNQYKLLYDLLPLVETNMDNASIIDAAIGALSMDRSGLVSYRLPVDGSYKSGTYNRSYVILSDLSANSWAAHQMIFELAGEETAAKVLKPGPSLPPRTPSPSVTPQLTPVQWTTDFPGGFIDPTFTSTPEVDLTPVPTIN